MVVRQPEPQVAAPTKRQDTIQASYLTHELRAPVTSIRLGLEMLQEQLAGKLIGSDKQVLTSTIRNTARLEGLINDIMDYSKVMAGRMELCREACEPRSLVADAADALQAAALSKGVKLVKEVEDGLPRISAEGRRIVQALTNLISNAVKFTPPQGTVTVSARAGRYEHEGTVIFRVKDTGCGIKLEDLDKVFDMFSQLPAGHQKKTAGTGLGLPLARFMVELHGGRIWAESWKGAGASFYFTIPITPEDMPEPFDPYPKPVEYHGLLVSVYRRLNALLALFV